MEKAITFLIEEDVLNELRAYAKKETGSKKALSGTLNKIIKEYLRNDTPIPSSNAQTHFKDSKNINEKEEDIEEEYNIKGIKAPKKVIEIIKEMEKNYANAITVPIIIKITKEKIGFGKDPRTIKKYLNAVMEYMRNQNFINHPANPNVYIKDPKSYFTNYEQVIQQYGELKFIPIENLKLNKYL